MLSARLLAKLEGRLREADLPLAVRLWNGATVGAPQGAQVKVTVNSPLVLASPGGFARSYVKQQIDVEGAARRTPCGAAAGA